MRRVVIVGGGVAGLCCAHYLRRHDVDTTVIESNRIGSGASFGNGGWICPAQAGPLPEPGLVRYGLRSLFDRDSALYFDPRNWRETLPWLLRFRTYCNARDYGAGVAAIAELGKDAIELIEGLIDGGVDCELFDQGMLVAARDVELVERELARLAPMRAFGYEIPNQLIGGDELRRLEPALAPSVAAGFLIRQHRHLRPDLFTVALASSLRAGGATIVEGAEVVDFEINSSRVTGVRTAGGDFAADAIILAAGAWSTPIARHFGVNLPLQPGKGYSFSVRPRIVPRHAILLADVHVGCTPFGDEMRIGGTMEFSGLNLKLDQQRVLSILKGAAESFVPWQDAAISQRWAGLRPMTPDGLPLIDRVAGIDNAYVATGYAMQGMTIAAPAARALVGMMVDGERPSILEPFRLDRFSRRSSVSRRWRGVWPQDHAHVRS